MITAYILLFVAGGIGTNGIPHFIKGVTGEKHMTPFAKPSSPVVNVIWGTLNILFGLLAWLAAMSYGPKLGPAVASFFMGSLITSLLLALFWEDDLRARGK